MSGPGSGELLPALPESPPSLKDVVEALKELRQREGLTQAKVSAKPVFRTLPAVRSELARGRFVDWNVAAYEIIPCAVEAIPFTEWRLILRHTLNLDGVDLGYDRRRRDVLASEYGIPWSTQEKKLPKAYEELASTLIRLQESPCGPGSPGEEAGSGSVHLEVVYDGPRDTLVEVLAEVAERSSRTKVDELASQAVMASGFDALDTSDEPPRLRLFRLINTAIYLDKFSREPLITTPECLSHRSLASHFSQLKHPHRPRVKARLDQFFLKDYPGLLERSINNLAIVIADFVRMPGASYAY